MQWQWIVNAKDIAQLTQVIATTGAILLAAWLFRQRRKPYPRLKIAHTISNHLLQVAGSDKRLIHIAVTIENTGERLFRPQAAYLHLHQIRPIHSEIADVLLALPDAESLHDAGVMWPSIARSYLTHITELDPGESESHYCDFLIDPELEVIKVYTYVENPIKKDTGWNTITVYEIVDTSNRKEESSDARSTSTSICSTYTTTGNQARAGIGPTTTQTPGATANGEKVRRRWWK